MAWLAVFFLADFDCGWLEAWGDSRGVEQTPVGSGFRRIGGDREEL